MPIKVSCNSCGGVLHAPDDSAGKRGRCPTCGTILAIPADGLRVPAEAVPPGLGAPVPQPASTYGIAPEPLAFPRPPAFGAPEGTKSSYGGAVRTGTAPGALASRLPPDPRKGDPFSKPSAPIDKTSQRWQRVKSGLGMVRWGLLAWMLALLIPTLLAMLEQNGVALPEKNPGLFDVPGLTMADEIKAGTALVFFTIGGLMIVLGRLRVNAVPTVTGARGLATAAAFASVLSFAGFLAMVILAISATTQGAPPKLIPHQHVLAETTQMQKRVEGYVHHLFLDGTDFTGQVQRYGAVAFVVFGVLAELWFLGVLGRLAVHLRNDRAVGRVNRFAVGLGLLFAIAAFSALWFDLGGRHYIKEELTPKWNALAPGVKIALRAALGGLSVLLLVYWSGRVVRSVRQAVIENTDAS